MKYLLFIMAFLTLQWGVMASGVVAQQHQQVVMEDYAIILQLSPETIQHLGENQVHQRLAKELGPLYAGYVQGQRQFVIRRSAVMASLEPLKNQVQQLYPRETYRSITNVEYEKIEKSLTN